MRMNISTNILTNVFKWFIIYVGGEKVARKQFTTTIEEDTQKQFKSKCLANGDKMNDVLEAFMESYIKGNFIVEKKVKFSIKRVDN